MRVILNWDGDRAHKSSPHSCVRVLPNLWSNLPLFQIDGNFGATAGIAEMLPQSHGYQIYLPPAPPQRWSNSSVTGMRPRGNDNVDMQWGKRQLQSARSSGELQLRLPQNNKFTLRRIGDNKILNLRKKGKAKAFDTRAGDIYLLTNDKSIVTQK